MRPAALVLVLTAMLVPVAAEQTALDRTLESQLKRVFPSATSFSPKQTSPVPHYVAYTGNPGSPTVAGYVFWTTELEPLERGYDGPIKTSLTAIFRSIFRSLHSSSKAKIFAIRSKSAATSPLFLVHRSPSTVHRAPFETARAASLGRC